MRFFTEGLNPFKIQTIFNPNFFLNFIIQNLEIFGSWANRKFVPHELILRMTKFGNF
jgi:hypothetical protein